MSRTAVLAFLLFAEAGAEWPPLPFAFRAINPATDLRYRETMLAADIDRDGDLDFFSGSGRGAPSWWFERTVTGWNQRLVSDSNFADVGASLLDVDGDGWLDKVSSVFWYRNPGFPAGGLAAGAPDPVFTACRYSDLQYVHDIYAADFDGDGRKDILSLGFDGYRWFRAPPGDSACGRWEERMIHGPSQPSHHGGIAAGDVDGDGDMDVTALDRWFENADGRGSAWTEHANIPFGDIGTFGYGPSGRAKVVDMDGDGHNDLVQSECDASNGRVAWFANPDGKGLRWVAHLIKDSTDGQDFHSLLTEDFDQDGDLDIFSAGSNSSAGPLKAYIWENADSKSGVWREHVILESKLVIHDAAAADLDGDGDLDILCKDWAGGTHFYLENGLVSGPDAGLHDARTPAHAGLRRKPWAFRKVRFDRRGSLHTADGRLLKPGP